MKQKSHSGLKKRIKVRKSGTVAVKKACKNHLLSRKSKRQKKLAPTGYAVPAVRMRSIRRLLAGVVQIQN